MARCYRGTTEQSWLSHGTENAESGGKGKGERGAGWRTDAAVDEVGKKGRKAHGVARFQPG